MAFFLCCSFQRKTIFALKNLNWISIIINNLMMQRVTKQRFFFSCFSQCVVFDCVPFVFDFKLKIWNVALQRSFLTLLRSSPTCNRIFRIFHVKCCQLSFSCVVFSIVHAINKKKETQITKSINNRIKTFFNSSLHCVQMTKHPQMHGHTQNEWMWKWKKKRISTENVYGYQFAF